MLTHPKAALDEEDESAGEGGALTQDCQDVLAGHIAGIHHQLHHPEQSFNTNGQLADRYRDIRLLYRWSLLICCAHNSMVLQNIVSSFFIVIFWGEKSFCKQQEDEKTLFLQQQPHPTLPVTVL